jgi:hypothetical protein
MPHQQTVKGGKCLFNGFFFSIELDNFGHGASDSLK